MKTFWRKNPTIFTLLNALLNVLRNLKQILTCFSMSKNTNWSFTVIVVYILFPVFWSYKHKYLQNYGREFLLLLFWSETHWDFLPILRYGRDVCRFCHKGIILSTWFQKSLCQDFLISYKIHQYSSDPSIFEKYQKIIMYHYSIR